MHDLDVIDGRSVPDDVRTRHFAFPYIFNKKRFRAFVADAPFCFAVVFLK
jgi:hypothetical protein